MKLFTSVNDPEIARILLSGGVGVLRTDTLYGIVGRAGDERAIHRIYELKGRDETKSPIVLISSTNQLFDEPSMIRRTFFESVWPGKVSVILPSSKAPSWIRRGNQSVAYRLPDDVSLTSLITQTGPLAAPSANPEGKAPAMNIDEANAYFGEKVDFYVDGGQVTLSEPSQLISVSDNGEVTRLR
jgi:L-threonylcarbamoyladenylate synthase